MDNRDFIRKMLDVVDGKEATTKLNESVHITLDGKEAEDMVARLVQLSGAAMPDDVVNDELPPSDSMDHSEEPIALPPPTNLEPEFGQDIDGPVGTGLSEPVPSAFDQPEFDSSRFVVDNDWDEFETESECNCDKPTMENADYDYKHKHIDTDGEEVDPENYIYKPTTPPQRMVKGVMGDNPMLAPHVDESIERFKKYASDYAKFLSESNEDGHESPLTSNSRNEFNKDPFGDDEEAVDDGSMSPLSTVKREDVPK